MFCFRDNWMGGISIASDRGSGGSDSGGGGVVEAEVL